MEEKAQSLRGPLLALAVIVAVCVGFWAFVRAKHNTQRQAYMHAIRAGRLPLDPTDEFLSVEQYEQLRKELAAQRDGR